MQYHPYKMTRQSRIAVSHLATVAVLFAILQLATTPHPLLERLVGWTFFVLVTPLGLLGIPAAISCRCDCGGPNLSGYLIAGMTFAANSYLWAWAITRIRARGAKAPSDAVPTAERNPAEPRN